ncbi:DinB family protein [Paenibacillus sp. UNC451MF]|uniref:DinB family protein n=1 Tax=Paenibacillus sp. UNC451MF TaxID=1449063 RepID=UPI00048D8C33|nr:DinB family protein [Paenibacillus sp. UNC451MF]
MENPAKKMYDFHVWANQTMINRLKELPEEVYTREIQSVFSSVCKAISHIYIVDTCWLKILYGKSMNEALAESFQLQEQTEAKSVREMEILYAELAERYRAILVTLDNMDETITLDNPYAGVRDTSYSEILLQIVNHATYHRGNITAMLRQMGHASVMTEYALYWYS